MVPPRPEKRSEKKEFRLVKFFAYASFTVLILFSFPFSVVVSQKAKGILTRSYGNYALLLGQNLNHQVFQNFVLPTITRYGEIRLRDKEQYRWMDIVVRNTIHSFRIDRVNIYDIRNGVIAYSTDRRLLGKKAEETEGYKKAIRGEYSSRLLSGEEKEWYLPPWSTPDTKKLRTYVPFRGPAPAGGKIGHVLGVFELIQDMTPEYRSIARFQYLIFGLSILIMGLIFVALLLIVRKAERIIEERAREQMDLESQLHQAERLAALGQMCAGVSHEIRNPLGIIRSTAELMGGLPGSDDSQKKLSAVIVEESNRLDNIVTEFLDFARPLEPDFETCRLEEILRKNLAFLQAECDKNGITVRHNLDGTSFMLEGDPQLLYRGFLNIFVNAIQSMENGGSITVNVAEEKDRYSVAIGDTGCGIGRENLAKIYNPFFSTKDKGSGLGVPIVRNIVEGHGGAIRIESEEGRGTTVIITLPKRRWRRKRAPR